MARRSDSVDTGEPGKDIGDDNGPPMGPAHPADVTDTAQMPVLDLTRQPARKRPDPCLVVTGLSVHPVFADVSFSAGRGELVAVIGDSGAGRSSLLLSIAGRLRSDSGRVSIDGRSAPAYVRSKVAVARAGSAVEPDPYLTVGRLMTESVLMGCPAGVDEIRAIAELVGVSVNSEEVFGGLPMVDRTLLAIAFAAAERTPVIVIDDVDAGLGNTAAACVWAALRILADNDRVVVATSLRPDLSPDTIVRIAPKRPGADDTTVLSPVDPSTVDHRVREEP